MATIFALTASLFALKEKCSPVPGLPNEAGELGSQMRLLANELRVVESLQSWSTVMRDVLESDRPRKPRTPHKGLDRYYFLIEIDVDARTTKVTPFPPEFIQFAHTKYL